MDGLRPSSMTAPVPSAPGTSCSYGAARAHAQQPRSRAGALPRAARATRLRAVLGRNGRTPRREPHPDPATVLELQRRYGWEAAGAARRFPVTTTVQPSGAIRFRTLIAGSRGALPAVAATEVTPARAPRGSPPRPA